MGHSGTKSSTKWDNLSYFCPVAHLTFRPGHCLSGTNQDIATPLSSWSCLDKAKSAWERFFSSKKCLSSTSAISTFPGAVPRQSFVFFVLFGAQRAQSNTEIKITRHYKCNNRKSMLKFNSVGTGKWWHLLGVHGQSPRENFPFLSFLELREQYRNQNYKNFKSMLRFNSVGTGSWWRKALSRVSSLPEKLLHLTESFNLIESNIF